MPRDRETYAYYLVGIEKDSLTHQALLADAKKRGTKHIPALISVRLGDYYEIVQEGQIIQRVSSAPQLESQDKEEEALSDNGLSNAAEADSVWD